MTATPTAAQLAGLRHIAAINRGQFGGTIRRDVLMRLVGAGWATVTTERVGGTTRRARIRTEITDMHLTNAGRAILRATP